MSKIKVNDKGILELATEVTDAIYDLLEDYPTDERWHTASKMHNAAIDLLYYVAIAVGDVDNVTNKDDWRYALKNNKALETIYIFAGKQGFYPIDPEVVVKIKELQELLQTELKKSLKSLDAQDTIDMGRWLKKYNMWKEMQS